MKDITLKIIGKQIVDGQDEEKVEFITDGRLAEKDGNFYIYYDETELSGMKGCSTSIKLTDRSMKMRRNGDALGMTTELYFEDGARFTSVYHTPYGPVGMEVLTNEIKNNFDKENGKGAVCVDYKISLDGIVESRNTITIEVM